MSFRFNRRITILPGVHLNLGLHGASVSVGLKGASVNIGRHGTHATLGVPGTGLSYRSKLGGGHHAVPRSAEPERDADGYPAVPHAIDAAQVLEILETVHLDTPEMTTAPVFRDPRPTSTDVAALMTWRAAKANFEAGVPLDEDGTARAIESAFGRLTWPRPTEIAYRVDDAGRTITIDVDLPELEDLPKTQPQRDENSGRIIDVAIPERRRADAYATHVGGIAFRLVGTIFASLPGVVQVRLSAYTTRTSGGSGLTDDYVAAGAVAIEDWRRLDLSNLRSIDVEDAVRRLGIRVERTGRGLLATIAPCA